MGARSDEKLEALDRALDRLGEALGEDRAENQLAVDGTIQRFEFCFELTWRAMKAAIEELGVDAPMPRLVLQHAFRVGWIDDEKAWIDMLKDRNVSAHVYKREQADALYERIDRYHQMMRSAHRRIADYPRP